MKRHAIHLAGTICLLWAMGLTASAQDPGDKGLYDQWAKAVQGYLASISFTDDCVGKVLDRLDKSRYADNPLVIVITESNKNVNHIKPALRTSRFLACSVTRSCLDASGWFARSTAGGRGICVAPCERAEQHHQTTQALQNTPQRFFFG